MKIHWFYRFECDLKKHEPYFEKAGEFFLSKLQVSKNLHLVLVDKKEMTSLNLQFRKKDGETDVLSFESYEEDVLGELVFCPPVIRENSKKHDLPFEDEFVYLILHGILHLLGYEHENDEEKAQKMFELQDKLFEEFLDDTN